MRRHPILKVDKHHNGVDIAAPFGSAVSAAAPGTVIFAGPRGTAGNTVIIDHGNGYHTYYMHNSALNVRNGDRVVPGQAIAKVGSTGRSTGNHLHFEVRKMSKDGKTWVPVNPDQWLGR